MKTLMRSLAVLIAMVLMGCSGEDWHPEEMGDEIGQVQQGLTVPDRYGQGMVPGQDPATGDNRCVATSPECWIPQDRTLRFKVDWAGFYDPNKNSGIHGDIWSYAVMLGIADADAAAGPNWTIDDDGTDNGEAIKIYSDTRPMRALQTLPTTVVQNGRTYKKWGKCSIEFGSARYSGALFGLNNDQTLTALRNYVRHEVGHCMGLGHEPGTIMGAVPHAPLTNYTLSQQIQLYNYVP